MQIKKILKTFLSICMIVSLATISSVSAETTENTQNYAQMYYSLGNVNSHIFTTFAPNEQTIGSNQRADLQKYSVEFISENDALSVNELEMFCESYDDESYCDLIGAQYDNVFSDEQKNWLDSHDNIQVRWSYAGEFVCDIPIEFQKDTVSFLVSQGTVSTNMNSILIQKSKDMNVEIWVDIEKVDIEKTYTLRFGQIGEGIGEVISNSVTFTSDGYYKETIPSSTLQLFADGKEYYVDV